MKKKAIRNLKRVLGFFITLIPKKNNRIYLKSKPDYSGNCKALSEYIIKNKPEYEIIWSVNDIDKIKNTCIVTVKNKTLKSFYYYATSRFVLTTHNEMIGIKSSKQVYISLWHGMPFKKICYLGEYDYLGMEDYSAQRISTSELMRSVISACFREKANNVYVTGQPRNDYLFLPTQMNDLDIVISEDKKIILYIPTFRQNNEDVKYSDGGCITEGNFLRVVDFSLIELDNYLSENNYHLLMKLHPYEEKYYEGKKNITKNITILDSATLHEKDIDLNQVLPLIDYLVTDYSSVYFDYLILNKPIIFLVPDIENYSQSRGGFTLEPFDFWTPGHKVRTQAELVNVLQRLSKGEDIYIKERGTVNSIVNFYTDNSNCARVFETFISDRKK